MAKPLVVQFHDDEVSLEISKVDRARLYGFKEIEVLDEEGRACSLATLSGDGHTVVPRGGTAVAYLSVDGLWCDRSELTPVDLEGKTIVPVSSTFSAPVPLAETASIDEYLEHNIRAVYQLQCGPGGERLLEELGRGTIFTFPFSFRGGLEADTAFLLLAEDQTPFLCVGKRTKYEYLELAQASGAADAQQGDEEQEEADLMDFDMI